MSASPEAREALHPPEWPPVWELPGLAARALWRLCKEEGAKLAQFAAGFVSDPLQRRKLYVFPLVLLGHALLVWLLIQNRWLVMSEIIIMIQPPVDASVVLEDPGIPGTAADKSITVAKAPDGLDLKTDDELGMNSLSVQSSVPWFNTTQLPDLLGKGQGKAAKRDAPRKPTRVRKPTSELAEKPSEPAATPATSIPRPEVAVIPPPQPQFVAAPTPIIPEPVPPPTVVPPIPAPVVTGPREIPPLWTEPPAPPPPALAVLPPTPVAPTPIAPVVAAPVPKPVVTPPPPLVQPPPPPVTAAVAPAPKPVPPPPKPAPEPPPTPPLELAPAAQLAIPTREAPVVPKVVADVTVKPVAPPVTGQAPVVAAPAAPSSQPAPVPAIEAPRNPMIVEIPRYTRNPVDQSSGNGTYPPTTSAGDVPRQSGGRVGADANVSASGGSSLGLGVPSPPAAPASAPSVTAGTSTPNTNAPPKPLNLNLPRVDPSRYGSGPIRQPNFSELANAQLRRGPAKDPMAEAVNNAEKPDCLKDSGMGLLGAPVAAYQAATGKCK